MNNPKPTMEASVAFAIKLIRENRAEDAEKICRAWLETKPGCALHRRLLGNALTKQNRLVEAEEALRFALSIEPGMPQLHEDLGSVCAMLGKFDQGITHLRRAIQLDPSRPLPYKKLGHALIAVGRGDEADEEFRKFMERDPDKNTVAQAIVHIQQGRNDEGQKLLKAALRENPDNVDAMRYLASTYMSEKTNLSDAEALLRRATQLAPDYLEVCLLLGSTLLERDKYVEAIPVFKRSTELAPDRPETWAGLAHAHARSSQPQEAADAYAQAVAINPAAPVLQMGYAHALKTVGDQSGALEAYRAAIAAKPSFGEVYWSMANLKIFRFEEHEVAAMEDQVGKDSLTESEAVHFHFALGKAWEDRKDFDKAWHHYDTGNKLQRVLVDHDPVEFQVKQEAIIEVFDRELMDKYPDVGCQSPDPIFIVGLPRSGSTLVEQILSSHSQVEGTSELPLLQHVAASMGRYRTDGKKYPELALEARRHDWRAYGEKYMDESRRHRQTDRPFFTDKLPNNFSHVGLIHLILPNAKIINTRRHPLDSCLGAYKQLWGVGQNFTYDTVDLADYYRQYHQILKHWHQVLPGKVLDVHYEDTVLDLEGQVRRILAHCGLPFEEQCLRFWETERAVNTASSEQVRQPIYRDALGKWRRYEAHLSYWQEELADIIGELPEHIQNAGC